MLRSVFLVVLTLVTVPSLTAQSGSRGHRSGQLDYFVVRVQPGAGSPATGGLGGRVIWPLPMLPGDLRGGVYAVHAPAESGRASLRAGAHVDAVALPAARRRPIEGLFTLSAGVVREEASGRAMILPPTGPAVRLSSLPGTGQRETRTGLSIAPGVSARLATSVGAGLRVDLRRFWDFAGADAAGTELSAGVSLPL